MSATEWVDSGEDWIAEPILWTSSWKHRGQTISYLKSELLLVDASCFAEVLALNPQAMNLMSVYARNFVIWLNEQDPRDLSDISQGEFVGGLCTSFMELDPEPSAPCRCMSEGTSRQDSIASATSVTDPPSAPAAVQNAPSGRSSDKAIDFRFGDTDGCWGNVMVATSSAISGDTWTV